MATYSVSIELFEECSSDTSVMFYLKTVNYKGEVITTSYFDLDKALDRLRKCFNASSTFRTDLHKRIRIDITKDFID